MTPKYKLTYFDITGFGEPIRFLLHYGGLEFEDNRISSKNWPAVKPRTPFGQLPLLEVDGKVLYQNSAIARYLGHVVGLAGRTPMENWEIDSVVDALADLRVKLLQFHVEQEQDNEKQNVLKDNFEEEILTSYLAKFDKWAEENGGYLANGRLTWADLYFVALQEFLMDIAGKHMIPDEYPNLQVVRNNVLGIPQIRAWLDKRPETKI